MVMKRFFRSARGGCGGGVKRRGGAAEASKDSSRDGTFDTSCDSQRNCLPQHVGKPGRENDLNQDDYDDVSSILLGESVGSPNNFFRNNNNNKRKNKNNNNNDTSKYDQNVSFVVQSTPETLRIVADVEFDQEGGMLQPDGTTLDVLRGRSFGTRNAIVVGKEELLRTSSPPSGTNKNQWSPLVEYEFEEEISPSHPSRSSSTGRRGGNGGYNHDDKTYSSYTMDGTMEAGDVEIFTPHHDKNVSSVSTEMSLFCLSLLEEHCGSIGC
jgi:hypothetical protein